MKKLLTLVSVLILATSILCGCKKETLVVPSYPLEPATITAALKEVGLDWKIADKTQEITEIGAYTSYRLEAREGILICSISNVSNENGRRLNFTFAPPPSPIHTLQEAIPKEDYEKVIHLATILFGDFDDQEQFYENYMETQENNTTILSSNNELYDEEKHANLDKIYQWNNEINGISCEIKFIQFNASGDNMELHTISIYNNDEYADPY